MAAVKKVPSDKTHRKAMIALAHGNKISALCHRVIQVEREKVNELRHTQINTLAPNTQHMEKAVKQLEDNLLLTHKDQYDESYQKLQTRSQEIGKRTQQLKDSTDHIFNEFNTKNRTELTKETPKQIRQQLGTLSPIIEETKETQTTLAVSLSENIKQINRLLPAESRVPVTSTEVEERAKPSVGG